MRLSNLILSMLVALSLVALSMGMSGVAFGQDAGEYPADGQAEGQDETYKGDKPKWSEMSEQEKDQYVMDQVEKDLQELREELDLTARQRSDIRQALENYVGDKMEAYEELHEAVQDAREELAEDMNATLSGNQMDAFKQWMEEKTKKYDKMKREKQESEEQEGEQDDRQPDNQQDY